ncbi:MAG: hypothetical protein JNL83_31940 [Myxococcales bacterium]|nr:hypothetical protein [Myxococcales bacterium]
MGRGWLALASALVACGGPTDVTFRVTVPDNTPEDDTIVVYGLAQQYVMAKIGATTHEVTVAVEDLGDRFSYRYTRNGMDFVASEAIAPETGPEFFANPGRTIEPGDRELVEDVVQRWRWFPATGLGPPAPAIAAPLVLAPAGGRRFQLGAGMQDLWDPAFTTTIDATTRHLLDVGYNAVSVSVPWQVMATDPLPKVGNAYPDLPNYPDDETLRTQLRSLVAAGLSVQLRPQVDRLDTSVPRSDAWWDAWFVELGDMMVHFAEIAREEGVTSFAFYPTGHHPHPPPNADARWRALVARVRGTFAGPVGVILVGFSDQAGTQYVIPDPPMTPSPDAFDFLVFDTFGAIDLRGDASDADLVAGAGVMLDRVAAVASSASLPVIVVPGYAAVAGSWRGSSFYSIDIYDATFGGEQQWQQGRYTSSPVDQARTIDAFLRAAASRPWVTGLIPFGYWNMDMPLEPGMSTRRLATEGVLERWIGAQP